MPFISASVISPYNDIRGGAEGGVTGTLLLDLYPGAAAAYSLRQLSTAYTGPAIQVRRSSDSALQDIGFLEGALDTASLLSFVGSGDGFVKTWYDQSGGGNNAAQASQSAQPQIVSSGIVINENGKISVKFNGTTDYIQNQLSVGGTVTAFAVSKIVSEPDYNFIYDSFGTGARLRLGLWLTQEYFADNADGSNIVAFSTTASNGLQNLFFAKHTNSDVSISVNQDTLQTVASTNFSQTTQHWNIGARNDGAEHFLDGTIQELIIYPSDQTPNRRAIEININNYYSVYPTALDFNPYNIWDSEHISINGTTTTLTDFNVVGPTYDLVNPTATAQPTYTSSDASFKELPSLTFDGVGEYVLKNVPNWRSSDTSGVFISVYRLASSSRLATLVGSNTNSNLNYINWNVTLLSTYRASSVTTSGNVSYRGSTNIQTTSQSFVVANASTGSEYKMWVNENAETLTLVSGELDGSKWFAAESPGFDTIAIGALLRTNLAPITANIKWCMSGYFPYVDDATTESLITALKNKYIDAPVPVDPILAFNPTNVWDSEHVIVDGTETTLVDFNNYGDGTYDLTNLTAAEQPSLNLSGSFNGLPSLTFDGTDMLQNFNGNFRSTDTTGMIISVWRVLGGTNVYPLTNSQTNTNFNYISHLIANVGNTPRMIIREPLKIYLGNADIITGSPKVVFVDAKTKGNVPDAYQLRVNNSIQSLNFTTGNSTGSVWYGASGGRTQLAIGGRTITAGTAYANIEWCFSGYFPYVSEQNTTDIVNYLMNKYGI